MSGAIRLREFIGKGASGEVYRAWHGEDAHRVDAAVKVLHPQLVNNPVAVARLQREAETLAQLDHPSVVRLLGTCDIDGRPAVVSAYVDGETLSGLVRTRPLPTRAALEVAASLVDALAHCHGRGIVHRDIKPSNIMVDRSGVAVLLDFGVASRATNSGDPTPTDRPGSWPYMAPERYLHGAVATPADLYAVGCVLHESLTGVRLFNGVRPEWKAKAARDPALLTEFIDARTAAHPAPVAAWIRAAVSADPVDRPTAQEAREQLTALVATAPGEDLATWASSRAWLKPIHAALIGGGNGLDTAVTVTSTTLPNFEPQPPSPIRLRTLGLGVVAVLAVAPLLWWWWT